MASIMNLNGLSFVELGAFPKFRVTIPNSSKINRCFLNPNTEMPPRSESRSLIMTPSSFPPNACLSSSFHRDCPLRLRATTKHDESGESSTDDDSLDLWEDMSQLDPDYVHYGLIYYNVLVLSCQITWMLNSNSRIPEQVKKDSVSCFQKIIKQFCISNVKTIEATDHYKIAELFLKQKCISHPHILSMFEYLPSTQQAEFINVVAFELMLISVLEIIDWDFLCHIAEDISDLILMDDDYAPNIAASSRTSKSTVAHCALVLGREVHEFIETQLRLSKMIDCLYEIKDYLDNVEEVVPRGHWPRLFQSCQSSLFKTHDCIIEMKKHLQEINSSMMGVGRLICECMTCYDFKKQKMKKHKRSTMEIDDFDDILKNLELADENLGKLLPYPNSVKCAREISTNYVNMRNIFLGFKHSLIAYRRVWRGIRMFDQKFNEARHAGKKLTLEA